MALALATLTSGLCASPASASALSPQSIEVNPVVDGALLASSVLVTTVLSALVKPTLSGAPFCSTSAGGACDAAALHASDRFSVQWQSHPWRHVSDWTQGAALAGGALAVGLGAAWVGPPPRRWRLATDAVVWAESVFVTQALVLGLKMAVRRPRPVAYRQQVTSLEQQQSFPSGHTAAAAAASMAAASLFVTRHPGRGPAAIAYATASTLVALTGIGRVAGGQHFLSDVVAGAAIGTAVGLIVPLQHTRALRVSVVPLHGGALASVGVPLQAQAGAH